MYLFSLTHDVWGKGWRPVAFICAGYSIVYVSVLFTLSVTESARHLTNAVDPFSTDIVVVLRKSAVAEMSAGKQ
jgi:hypothetical protein